MSKKIPGKRVAWTKSELNEFAIGLQKYGFSEKEKIAEIVTTREKQEVVDYLNSAERTLRRKHVERKRAKAQMSPYAESGYITLDSKLAVEVLEGPPIRRWNWMARSQQSIMGRKKDYSRLSMGDILEDFYEEAEEPENPQVIDVKAIYKFLKDCVNGKNPTELMPKESGLVLMLLKKMKEFQDSMDLDEERKYFTEYKGAVKFAPLKVKDEEKGAEEDEKTKDNQDKSEDEEMDEEDNPDTVKIPEELFDTFKTHYKLVESFNPLLVPLWFLNKHQASLEPLMKDILGSKEVISKQESDFNQ